MEPQKTPSTILPNDTDPGLAPAAPPVEAAAQADSTVASPTEADVAHNDSNKPNEVTGAGNEQSTEQPQATENVPVAETVPQPLPSEPTPQETTGFLQSDTPVPGLDVPDSADAAAAAPVAPAAATPLPVAHSKGHKKALV